MYCIDRTSLLVHLLTSTPLEVITNPPDPHNTHFVTAADLLDCLDSRKPDLKEGVWDIIEQVCRARDLMEQYEAGEIGKSIMTIRGVGCSLTSDRRRCIGLS